MLVLYQTAIKLSSTAAESAKSDAIRSESRPDVANCDAIDCGSPPHGSSVPAAFQPELTSLLDPTE